METETTLNRSADHADGPDHTHQDHHSNEHDHDHNHHDHEDDHHDHDHAAGPGEYVRLGVMALIIIASLTGWWRSFLDRDWLAFAGTVIGRFPIYKEAWANLLKRRMTMEPSMTSSLVAALAIGPLFTTPVMPCFALFPALLSGSIVRARP